MVVGVDTHKDSHSAAAVDGQGRVRATLEVAASGSGYRSLLRWAARLPGSRCWAVEGTGSYGAGLASYLAAQGELVLEGDRPKRRARGAAGKSDQLDAIRVALEALSREHHAQPRSRGQREAIRVLLLARQGAVSGYKQGLNQLYALVVTAPEPLRERLIRLHGERLVSACSRLRPQGDLETSVTATTLHAVARRSDADVVIVEVGAPHRTSWPSLVWAPWLAPSCSSPGRTPAASATRTPLPPWLGWHQCLPPAAASFVTDSTAKATASSTAPSTWWH